MHLTALKLSPLLLRLIASQNVPSESTETENPDSFQDRTNCNSSSCIILQMMQKIEEEKKEEKTEAQRLNSLVLFPLPKPNDILVTNDYENESQEEIYDINMDVVNRQTRADPCLSSQRG